MSTPASFDWFHAARFGLFVHWGAYSQLARGEWAFNREGMTPQEYFEQAIEPWHAENYDPREWAQMAKAAGMKYVVLTTRHHDGFCLWDTDTTDWSAARLGPKRDLIAPYVEALREAGLKVGFYYSVMDWHHADYPGGYYRDAPTQWDDESKRKSFVAYYRAQLQELMTNYGAIDILWYDGCAPAPLDGEEINTFVKTLQPDILINNRNGAPFDFKTSEGSVGFGEVGAAHESCVLMTRNMNWGFHASDEDWKTPREILRDLILASVGAGNLLLNVGPRGDGSIPQPARTLLGEIGSWLERNGEFLSNSGRGVFAWNHCGMMSVKGETLYLHIFTSPGARLCLAQIKNRVLRTRLLATGQELPFEQKDGRLFVELPVPLPDPHVTTIAFDVEGQPEQSQLSGESSEVINII